ncbi:hypothetical protein [Streptomyces halobius]|uniref:Gram-positive cocci surface proteins LPxTG domain-containing protein n=1 Tax=Streptomyces halobius TaxID=2879846 RepID=A0ABY4M3Q5_9ACTN|nr:hypothetical protein [Streptomyces halobius]UQA91878.1 hypothetical protein K9S39_08430 [Streptomyces halobius]
MASSPRTATRRRNLVRTSAIAAAAGSALLLPASAAFADSPAPASSASPNAEQDTKQDGSQGQGTNSQEKDKGREKDKTGERRFVRAQGLSGGFTAKVYQLGQNHYQADMYAKAPDTGKLVRYDTLETKDGKPAYGRHNGAHFALQPDGTMTSWAEGGNKKADNKADKKADNKDAKNEKGKKGSDGKKKGQKNGQNKVTPGDHTKQQGKVIPKGGVKAGAEGVETGDNTMLLAGGGAAAAASGLGFAALRRRRADESGDNA